MTDTTRCNEPHLGLATTRELLAELTARIEVDYSSGGGGLDYSTVNGRPLLGCAFTHDGVRLDKAIKPRSAQ